MTNLRPESNRWKFTGHLSSSRAPATAVAITALGSVGVVWLLLSVTGWIPIGG
jgi:hypothetical protein